MVVISRVHLNQYLNNQEIIDAFKTDGKKANFYRTFGTIPYEWAVSNRHDVMVRSYLNFIECWEYFN
jgi:hypothetical protein